MTLLAASNSKEFWYLTRGTGVVALLLLTAVLVLGIAGTVRWQRPGWPRFLVADLHKYLTLLSIVFVTAHVVTTVADGFAPIRLLDAVVPFASPYRPIWRHRLRYPSTHTSPGSCAKRNAYPARRACR